MRILTVFTGGTVSCSACNGTLAPDTANNSLLTSRLPEHTFDAVQPYTILSENLGTPHWEMLCRTLRQHDFEAYDGVIIVHGTDTLLYTAAFLSCTLGLCETPVVLTSANYPLHDSRSNGYDNFDAAVCLIEQQNGKGVFVSYRNTGDKSTCLHRGSELLPHAPYSDSVYSLFNNVYGTVENGRFLANPDYREHGDNRLTGRMPHGSVIRLCAHVGMTYPVLSGDEKAVLIEGYHSGTLPTGDRAFTAFCRDAAAKAVPLYLTGDKEGFDYESKAAFPSLGIRVLPPLSPITAYIKLWLA